MKNCTLTIAVLAISFVSFAQHPKKKKDNSPKVYIMMNHGKLTEVNNGKSRLVRRDITLVNESTIHPNGMINVSSGELRQLKEGEYITMDGRIRLLKDMVRPSTARR